MASNENQLEVGKRKGIYLLPNLFTTAALFAGFYAIVAGMQGNYEHASSAIFIAMIMDSLDGRIARLTGTQSAFGAQYDSLSDMVSFGLTPALVSYKWGLELFGKPGWLAAFMYAAASALRLARFNTQIGVVDKKYFIGLPSPAAAAIIAGMVWVGSELGIDGRHYAPLVAIIVVLAAFLMVSNIRYYSFKEIDFKGSVPFVVVLVIMLIFTIIAFHPPTVLLAVFSLYALSGPYFWYKQKRKLQNVVLGDVDDEDKNS